MNTRKLIIPTLSLLFSALVISGCKKDDDDNAPTITLVGDNPQTVVLQGDYVELGATASDPEDGDLTSSIVIDATAVDENTKGTYGVDYSVTDADGNLATETRVVNVENSSEDMAGNYSVIDSCGVFPGGQIFTYSQVVTTSDIINNRIHFNKFADYSNNTGIYANVTGNAIDLPLQTANNIGSAVEDHTFSGGGAKTSNGFFIIYVDNNLDAGAQTTCRAWFTKQ